MNRFGSTFLGILFTIAVTAQEGMHNLGMLRIHSNGGIGFYGNLVNNGVWDQNMGLVGFYGTTSPTLTGFFSPVFNDVEIMLSNGIYLDVSIRVQNNFNFISGDVATPRSDSFVSLGLDNDAFHTGARDISKVNGYVTIHEKRDFIFPIGDSEQMRPLVLHSEAENLTASCAYFFEDPNNPTYLSSSFNTNVKEFGITSVGTSEFWHLQGTVPSTVQIAWNPRSAMDLLTDDVTRIILVGWHKSTHQWKTLGGNGVGDLAQGFVTSKPFIPQDYEVITFGTSNKPELIVDLPNYLLTPNGDGINDFLEISELELSPNNQVRIYDRNGLLVFEQTNYTNQFNGYATEGDVVINRNRGLPSGVYFYLVFLHDLGAEYQGFLYLANK